MLQNPAYRAVVFLNIVCLKQKITDTLLNSLLFTANGLVILLLGMLGWFNRFAGDDYWLINNTRTYGIYQGMTNMFSTIGGRWTSYLAGGVIYKFYQLPGVLFIYSSILFILFLSAIYFLVKIGFELFELSFTPKILIQISILFFGFIFLITPAKGEVWFWIASTTVYLQSMIMFLIGLILIMQKKNTILIYVLIAFCMTYAGGASEVFAMNYILFLIGLIGYCLFFSSNTLIATLKSRGLYKMIFGLSFLFFSFLVLINAEGIDHRLSWLPASSVKISILMTFKSVIKFFLIQLLSNGYWLLIFNIIFLYLGAYLAGNKGKEHIQKYGKRFFYSFILLIIMVSILFFPTCYVLSDICPGRAETLAVILVAVFCAAWSFVIGFNCIKNNFKVFIFLVCVFICSMIFLAVDQFKIISTYSSAFDKRITYLKELNHINNHHTISLQPLPQSGFLFSAEISSDTMFFSNEHLKQGLQLGFKVRKKLKPTN